MNSSIFNFNNPFRSRLVGAEWCFFAILVSGFLFSELLLRSLEQDLSKDVRHIREANLLASVIRRDGEGLPEDVQQILFIGNSSIRAGLNPEQLEGELRSNDGIEVRSYLFHPDGGNVNAWRWAWRRYFQREGGAPDWVLLCGGNSHFDDGLLDSRSAARYFVANRDVFQFLKDENSGFEEMLSFVAAKVSASYASRSRVQRRLMDQIMPYNREVLFEMTNPAISGGGGPEVGARPRLARNLEVLIGEIQAQGPKVGVVLMPNREDYSLSESQFEVIEKTGALLLDFRVLSGISSENFYDKAHLDENGAHRFTSALAKAVAEAVVSR